MSAPVTQVYKDSDVPFFIHCTHCGSRERFLVKVRIKPEHTCVEIAPLDRAPYPPGPPTPMPGASAVPHATPFGEYRPGPLTRIRGRLRAILSFKNGGYDV